MNYATRPTYAQLRREGLEKRKADRRDAFIETSVSRPALMGARLFPDDAGLADRIRMYVAAWFDATPCDPGATIEQAAFHETGHLVVAEWLGMQATKAEIHGSPFGRAGWGGSAGAWNRPVIDGGRWGFTVQDVENEAVFALAGPVTEYLFAIVGPFAPDPWKRGDLYVSLGEILEGCILVAYVADQRRGDRAAVLDAVLMRTARGVLALADHIEQIAVYLRSQKSINRYGRKASQILSDVRRCTWDNSTSLNIEQSKAVHDITANAPVDIIRFTEEIGR